MGGGARAVLLLLSSLFSLPLFLFLSSESMHDCCAYALLAAAAFVSVCVVCNLAYKTIREPILGDPILVVFVEVHLLSEGEDAGWCESSPAHTVDNRAGRIGGICCSPPL